MAQHELVSGKGRQHTQHVTLKVSIIILVLSSILAVVPQPYVQASGGLPQYIEEFKVPTQGSAPLALIVDRNGTVWFTESNSTKLASFDPNTDTFREYKVPDAGDMWGITIDAQGNIWMTQYSLKGSISPGGTIEPGGTGRLIRFNPSNGNFTVINIPTPGAFPFRITTDAQGRVWFTELLGNRIASYDPTTGKIQEYTVPTPFAGPADLTFDVHGTLWFTEAYNESVAKFDLASDTFVQYPFSTIDPTQYVGSPVGIAATGNGIVWVADHGGNWVVKLNSTSQHVTLYPTHFPPPQVYPISLVNDLVVDRQGRVWFTEHGGNSIGYLDPNTHKMVEFAIPTGPISTALWLALAPNGDLWFTEWSSNKLGVVHANLPVPLTLSASANSLSIPIDGQALLSLQLNSSNGYVPGTWVYSWPSYNLGDVNVTFSPQGNQTSVESQARVTVSSHNLPGEYVLGLGFDAGTVRVWSMVQVVVTAQSPINFYMTNEPWLPVAAFIMVLLATFMILRRVRGLSQRKRDKSLTM